MGIETLTRQSTFESFFTGFTKTYITQERLGAYIEEKKSPVTYNQVKQFFESNAMRDALKVKWDFERGENMGPNRTVHRTIMETLGHTLAGLSGELTLLGEHGHGLQGTFDHTPPEEIEIISKSVMVLMGYLNTELRKSLS